jgi:hypothetical protein
MERQQLIDTLTDTFMQRCEYFIEREDYAKSHALYSEFVIDEVEPEDWIFLHILPSLV